MSVFLVFTCIEFCIRTFIRTYGGLHYNFYNEKLNLNNCSTLSRQKLAKTAHQELVFLTIVLEHDSILLFHKSVVFLIASSFWCENYARAILFYLTKAGVPINTTRRRFHSTKLPLYRFICFVIEMFRLKTFPVYELN